MKETGRPMEYPPALLETWMRDYYFSTEIDIGSSGVENFSLAELRALVGLSLEEIDQLVFQDSETLGGSTLRRAIADRWAGGDVARVMATHGSSEANFLLMHALLEPGDEVVVLDPCYPQLYTVAEVRGCRLRKWPLRFEERFVPSLEEARKVITEQTRMVVVNFPHNPTGASVDLAGQEELVRIVSRVGAYLVWDNAFAELTYDAPQLPDVNLLYERGISMGTLSKSYGLPGLRVGWCLAPPEVLARMIRLRDYLTLHLSPLVELIACKAIENADRLVALRLAQARQNLATLAGWVERHRGLVDWVPPRGGVSTFLRLKGALDVDNLCRRLAEAHSVLLVPGSCFGYPQHVRLGFGCRTDHLEEGLYRLSVLLKSEAGIPEALGISSELGEVQKRTIV